MPTSTLSGEAEWPQVAGAVIEAARFSISSGCEQERGHGMRHRTFKGLPCSKPMLKTLFSLRTATRVFEKPLPIRRPESSDIDGREGNIRCDVAATLRQKSSTTSCL